MIVGRPPQPSADDPLRLQHSAVPGASATRSAPIKCVRSRAIRCCIHVPDTPCWAKEPGFCCVALRASARRCSSRLGRPCLDACREPHHAGGWSGRSGWTLERGPGRPIHEHGELVSQGAALRRRSTGRSWRYCCGTRPAGVGRRGRWECGT